MSTFFDRQFDGPTEYFATPHVTLNAPHPYTDEMVIECLRVIGSSPQSRITRNCRIYVDGALVCPFASRDIVRRIVLSESIREINWSEIFGGHDFLIFINRAALYVPKMLSASKAFVGAFDRRFGRTGISIEHHLIIGHYVETSFGVHIDDPTDRIFHFNLGPHHKTMSLWPRHEFLTAYGGDAARLRRTVDHAEPTTYVMPVGSAFFLPADYHHVGSSQEGVSIVVALAFSRQSESLLLREALHELRQLVPLQIPTANYYRDFLANAEVGEYELIARYDRVDLTLAHQHAVARRFSNNSFDEIPELKLPTIETTTGNYIRSDTPIEVVKADEGTYVYSNGHRAFLNSEKQIRDLNHLLAVNEFEIGQDLGFDVGVMALRVWLVATGAARRRSDD